MLPPARGKRRGLSISAHGACEAIALQPTGGTM